MGLPKKVEIKCGIKKNANGAFALCKDGIMPRCVEYLDESGECPYKITIWTIREGEKDLIPPKKGIRTSYYPFFLCP